MLQDSGRVDLLGSAFISPAALPDCPAAQVYREALAGFLATQAAGKLYPLADHPQDDGHTGHDRQSDDHACSHDPDHADPHAGSSD